MIIVSAGVFVVIALGSLLPAAARLLPWYAPQAMHVIVYAGFAVMVHMLFGFGRRPMLWTVLVAGGAGLVLELTQAFLPVREFSLEDAGLNFLGALIGVGAFELVLGLWRVGKGRPVETGEPGGQKAGRVASEISALSHDRLLAAWPLLLRCGHIAAETAMLAERVHRVAKPLGNHPAGDRTVLQALDDAGIRCLLLKGTLLAHTVYDAPVQRSRGDTDMLVAPQDRIGAEAVLQRIGMARGWQVTAKTSDTQDQWQGRVDGHAVILDLHWQLLNHPAFSDLFEFDALWARRTRAVVDGYAAAGLGHQDALLHAVLHYFAHHGDEFRPAQWLLDMDLLWRAMDEDDRNEFVRRAEDLEISGLTAEALRLTRARFSTPIAPETLADMRLAGEYQWRTKLLKVGSGPLSEQLFKLRAIKGWRARLAHLRALLFPSAQYMRSKYPDAGRWLLPWLYVKRMVDSLVR